MNVYIHKPVNYSDMQGPCSEGYHIPLKDEWVSVVNIWKLYSGSSKGINFGIDFKIPFSGFRSYDTGNITSQGTTARYRSSSVYKISSSYGAYTLIFENTSSSGVGGDSWDYQAQCHSIRPFKDVPVVPTQSWTTIYGTSIESGGIYWSSTDGLISLSSDGTNWITMSDKNLGATTVYSDGATLSEANCGKYYQRGNNYGFPFSGSITTSSTRVDASGYGPGNYYSSSTFITVSSSPYDWSSVQNDNLRGGVTGIGGQSELKNAYIGNGLS